MPLVQSNCRICWSIISLEGVDRYLSKYVRLSLLVRQAQVFIWSNRIPGFFDYQYLWKESIRFSNHGHFIFLFYFLATITKISCFAFSYDLLSKSFALDHWSLVLAFYPQMTLNCYFYYCFYLQCFSHPRFSVCVTLGDHTLSPNQLYFWKKWFWGLCFFAKC